MYQILKGVKVIDLTTVVLGPFLTQILGDLGAEVIKVESPVGDIYRGVAPGRHPKMGAGFLNINRNKRSIVLNLKSEEGRAVFDRLINGADVFIHNMRLSAAERLGLTYTDLAKKNASLIYCAAIGFGSKGPYADRPAYDDIIQAVSGMAHLEKNESGAPNLVPTLLGDKIGGFYALYGILSALYYREKTGKGLSIEAPMFESLSSFILTEHLQGQIFDEPMGTFTYKRLTNPYRRPHRTKDAYIAVMPYSYNNWKNFLTLIGREDLAAEEWLKDPSERSKRIAWLYQILDEAMMDQTTDYWLEALQRCDIPCGPVNTLDDLLMDPHLKKVSFFEKTDHPTEGLLNLTRQPVVFDGPEKTNDLPAPNHGAHTREILEQLGYSQQEIIELEKIKAISL